ncbi:hypothetical protein [Ramlibacter sp.]|uniref:hypothetical protein n=1 Tax=Ramlibacter sp. TaxID=1917967 RepID=UPI0026325B9C|nr:hypothetical protein [Ramlibacter sp.]MDB5956767.1 hypothetical protein [Ramlibacter sp.]
MGWNRNHAARLLHGEERALFEASLPERAHALSDRQLLASAEKLRRTRERLSEREPKAQMLGEALLRVEQEASRRKISGPETLTGPRAGRTGGLGSRAEKPSEGTQGRTTKAQPQPGRSSKSPNAAGRTAGNSDKPQAQKARRKRDDLPLPVRDTTA